LAIARRYGVGTRRAKRRIRDSIEVMAAHGCRPTFPTPGRVVDANGEFCLELQERGAELAVHGYDHLDFRALTREEARTQLELATDAFARTGIECRGFRCPYLSCTETVFEVLPDDLRYSSNQAIWWDADAVAAARGQTAVFGTLEKFYAAESAERAVSVPTLTNGVVEIPASLPDDLQLYDGLKLGSDGLRAAWLEILEATHRRGELFTALFHPEAWDHVKPAVKAVLAAAERLEPPVWIARLQDVGAWWHEKAGFSARLEEGSIAFDCSDDASILVRGLATTQDHARPWLGGYAVLAEPRVRLRADERPFVGVTEDAPSRIGHFLREQGYLVETGPDAERCSVVVNAAVAASLGSDRALIDHIESSSAPLVRFWRWPNGARSALCITGDLDALSLSDYAARFFNARWATNRS
jgi:peptidoglycan/xylan/chitin deacetylase (PgdA/CDA1 family)